MANVNLVQTQSEINMSFHATSVIGTPAAHDPHLSTYEIPVKPSKAKFDARLLTSRDEIDQARHLLYQVYIEEMGWVLANNNPSGLSIGMSKFGPILVDNFDAEALWFGCMYEGHLVGVHRAYFDETRLEIEHYTSIPAMFKNELTVELTRLAITAEHRSKSPVFVLLMAAEFEFLRERGVRYALGTAPFPSPGDLYLNAGMKRWEGPAFKYYSSDPEMVSIIYYDFSEPEKLNRLIRLARGIKSSTRHRF